LEISSIWASAALNDYLEFPYVGQVFCIEPHAEVLSTGKTRHETIYGVTFLGQQRPAESRSYPLSRTGTEALEQRKSSALVVCTGCVMLALTKTTAAFAREMGQRSWLHSAILPYLC
jgi:hypothetical protein